MTTAPLLPRDVMVERVTSTGYTLLADVTIEVAVSTHLSVRHLRVIPTRTGDYHLGYPSHRTEGKYADVVTLPKAWRAIVVDAVLEAAAQRGLVRRPPPASSPAPDAGPTAQVARNVYESGDSATPRISRLRACGYVEGRGGPSPEVDSTDTETPA
jgi:DNA-binding cell septation regulator SpoVG